MVHLAFRQIDRWMPFHITGREVYLVPMEFDNDGWFTAGVNGITPTEIETTAIADSVVQQFEMDEDFASTKAGNEWVYIRNPHFENYEFNEKEFTLTQTPVTLSVIEDSPTAICIRQRQMVGEASCNVTCESGEAGISLYMNESHHYDLCIRKCDKGYQVVKRSCIGFVECEQNVADIDTCEGITLHIRLDYKDYFFSASQGDKTFDLGKLETRYLSSEVACGFTGVMFALYTYGDEGEKATFKDLKIHYDM